MRAALRSIVLDRRDRQLRTVEAVIGRVPSRERRAISTFLRGLRLEGILPGISSIYWGFTSHLGLFRCDLMHPGVTAYTLVPVNSPMEPPAYPYRGYSDDGSGRGWANTANPGGGNYPQYTQNDMHLSGLWIAGSRSDGVALGFGAISPGAYMAQYRSSDEFTRARFNDSNSGDIGSPAIIGHSMLQRRASNDRRLFRNGVQAAAGNTASVGLPSGPFKLMTGITGPAMSQSIAVATIGASLTGLEAAFFRLLRDALDQAGAVAGPALSLQEVAYAPDGAATIYPNRVLNGGVVPLKGTMAVATGTNIEVKIVDGSSSTVVNWTVVASGGSGAAGVEWSGEITGVPAGGPYYAQARCSDGTAATPVNSGGVYVGAVDVLLGESIQAYDWLVDDTRPETEVAVAPNIFRYSGSRTFGWPVVDTAEQGTGETVPYNGAAAVHYGNLMSAYTSGEPVGLVYVAVPGPKIEHYLSDGPPWGTSYGDNLYDRYRAVIASVIEPPIVLNARGATGKNVSICHMTEGINDATDVPTTSYAQMLANMEQWLSEFRAFMEYDVPVAVTIMGRCLRGDPEVIDGVRRALFDFCDAHAADDVYIAGTTSTSGLLDDYHLDYQGRMDTAAWRARTSAFVKGLATSTGCGPKLTGLSVTGNAFTATVTHNTDGTTLKDKSGSASGAVTGFEIEVDGTARTITACALSSGTIVGTFGGAAKVTTARLRYQYAGDFDVTNPVYDDVVCAGVSTGRPMLPSNGWISE